MQNVILFKQIELMLKFLRLFITTQDSHYCGADLLRRRQNVQI